MHFFVSLVWGERGGGEKKPLDQKCEKLKSEIFNPSSQMGNMVFEIERPGYGRFVIKSLMIHIWASNLSVVVLARLPNHQRNAVRKRSHNHATATPRVSGHRNFQEIASTKPVFKSAKEPYRNCQEIVSALPAPLRLKQSNGVYYYVEGLGDS